MSSTKPENTWNVNPEEARALQEDLRKKVQLKPFPQKVTLIGGADISFNKYENTVYAGIIILDAQTLLPFAHALAVTEVHFPYIPGLLSFREIPALLKAWDILEIKPDVLMVDGHGIAHPRRLGIATHFGLATDSCTIGVAKKRLVGKFTEPSPEAGSFSTLMFGKETLGYVYRTKKNVKPVFVSPGHKTDLPFVLEMVKKVSGKYRIPEPTRQAHLLVNQLRRGEVPAGFLKYPAN